MLAVVLAVTLSAQQPVPEVLIALARDGWTKARAAAEQGGAPESLAPVRKTLEELEQLTQGTLWHLQGEYARAVIAAAIAAAQNEHGELDLQLAHARGLSDRLVTSAYPARWPLAINEAEAELYLAVYRYADAARAFRRAGNIAAACDAYRRGEHTLTGEPRNEARAFLKTCP